MGKAKQRRTADGGEQRRERVVGWETGVGGLGARVLDTFLFFIFSSLFFKKKIPFPSVYRFVQRQ